MPEELIDFKEEVTILFNFGKYASQVLFEANSTPTWTGKEGEQVIAYVTSGGGQFKLYTFIYANSDWRYTFFTGAT